MRVVVLGAGGPAGINVCRALKAAGYYIVGCDGNRYHLAFAERWCDEVMTVPPVNDPAFAAILTTALGDVDDLIHSQPEQGVRWLAENRELLRNPLAARRANVYLPSAEVIATCQNKVETAIKWGDARLRSFYPCRIYDETPDWLHVAADAFGLPFWLRATKGAGARGATLVEDLRTAHHWIRYWQTRGADIEWVAEEFLPGRDFCWTGLFHEGALIAGFARERLEWLYPHLAPSGRTGTPTVAATVHDERVNATARAAVLAVDSKPHGVYAVDLREDKDGIPRPTEINAGRFPTTSPLYHELGVNLCDLYARLATGEHVQPLGDDIYPAGVHLIRHIDCGHVFATADELVPELVAA